MVRYGSSIILGGGPNSSEGYSYVDSANWVLMMADGKTRATFGNVLESAPYSTPGMDTSLDRCTDYL